MYKNKSIRNLSLILIFVYVFNTFSFSVHEVFAKEVLPSKKNINERIEDKSQVYVYPKKLLELLDKNEKNTDSSKTDLNKGKNTTVKINNNTEEDKKNSTHKNNTENSTKIKNSSNQLQIKKTNIQLKKNDISQMKLDPKELSDGTKIKVAYSKYIEQLKKNTLENRKKEKDYLKERDTKIKLKQGNKEKNKKEENDRSVGKENKDDKKEEINEEKNQDKPSEVKEKSVDEKEKNDSQSKRTVDTKEENNNSENLNIENIKKEPNLDSNKEVENTKVESKKTEDSKLKNTNDTENKVEEEVQKENKKEEDKKENTKDTIEKLEKNHDDVIDNNNIDELKDKSIKTAPLNIKGEVIQGKLKITWNGIENVNSYDLFINDKIVHIDNVTEYISETLKENKIYLVKIRGKNSDILGPWSEELNISIKIENPKLPKNFKVESSSNGAKVIWDKVEGAESYDLEVNDKIINVQGENYYTIQLNGSKGLHKIRVRAKKYSSYYSDWTSYINLITASLSLNENLTLTGDTYVCNSTIRLDNKTLNVNGDFKQDGGSVYLDRGKLIVEGDYELKGSSLLYMLEEEDYVLVKGNFRTESTGDQENRFKAGTLEIKGDFVKEGGSTWSFYANGTHKVVLSGGKTQKVIFNNRDNSQFNILDTIGSAKVEFITPIKLKNLKNIKGENLKIIHSNITLQEDEVIDSSCELINTTINLNGKELKVNGSLKQGESNIYIDRGRLIIDENYELKDSSLLYMLQEECYILVKGNFRTESTGDQENKFKAGTLEVKGDFVKEGGNKWSFYANGMHKVVLSGDKIQKVIFNNCDKSQFNILDVSNAKEVDFETSIKVRFLKNIRGSKVTIKDSNINLDQNENIIGEFIFNNCTINMNGYTLNINSKELQLINTIIRINNKELKISGNLKQDGGSIYLDRGKLIVEGNYELKGSSLLYMLEEEDYVLVKGNFRTESTGDQENKFKAGTLEVKGDFIKEEGNTWNFHANGTHKVVLSGDETQKVIFNNCDKSQFNILDTIRSVKVEFMTPIKLRTIKNIKGENLRIIHSNITLQKNEVIDSSCELINTTINLNGKELKINGNLKQAGDSIYLNKGKLIVEGNYELKGSSLLYMLEEEDYVLVKGNFRTESTGDQENKFKAGTLEVKGNFVKEGGNKWSFYANGMHKVVLSGDKIQKVIFNNCDKSQFNILDVSDAKEVDFETSIKIRFLKNIRGSKVTIKDSNINLDQNENIIGEFIFNNCTINMNGYTLNINSKELQLINTIIRINNKQLKISGNLKQDGGSIYLDRGKLIIEGSYELKGSSLLYMLEEEDYVLVKGNFRTESTGDQENKFKAGTLEVKGDFVKEGGNKWSFYANGTHKVVLSGGKTQKVIFNNCDNSQFNILDTIGSAKVEFITPIKLKNLKNIKGENLKIIHSNITLQEDEVIDSSCELINTTINLNGKELKVNGSLKQGESNIYIDRGRLIIDENYELKDSSLLYMLQEECYILVKGNFRTESTGDQENKFKAGTLEVKGDFVKEGGNKWNFYANGMHKVVLSGNKIQKVIFNNCDKSQFNILDVSNAKEVDFETSIKVRFLKNIRGSKVTIKDSNINLDQNENITGEFIFNNCTINMNGYTLNINSKELQLVNTIIRINNKELIISGNLKQDGASIYLDRGKLIVEGNYELKGSSLLYMLEEEDYVLVKGNFRTESTGDQENRFKAGTLEVKGDFVKEGGNKWSFYANGTHKVVLSGGKTQKVIFNNCDKSQFNILDTIGSVKVEFMTPIKLRTIKNIKGENLRIIYSNITLQKNEVIDSSCELINTTINLNGKELKINGNVKQAGDSIYLNKGKLIVEGNYELKSSSLLYMLEEEDYVLVKGNFITESTGDQENRFKAGTLEVKGDFIKDGGNSWNFHANGTHRVVLSGAKTQKVVFKNSDRSQFNILDLSNAKGVEFEESVIFSSNLLGLSKIVNDDLTLVGTKITLLKDDRFNGDLELKNSSMYLNGHSLAIDGYFHISNSTVDLNSGKLAVLWNLNQNNSDIKINKGKLIVEDDYDIVGNSSLYMLNPSDYVLVYGNFFTESTQSHEEKLTNGVFELKGDFKEDGYQSDNFYASENHKVLLTGQFHQLINLKNHNSCRFNILDYSGSKGAIMETPVYLIKRIGKMVNVNIIQLINGSAEYKGIAYFIKELKSLGIDVESDVNVFINNLISETGIEYIQSIQDDLKNFIHGVIIGVDDNLFIGTIRGAGKLAGIIEGNLPEEDYSFMLGKILTDTVFIKFFNATAEKGFSNTKLYLGAAVVSLGAGAALVVFTSGAATPVAVTAAETSIKKVVINFTIAVLAEAGAIHSNKILNEDREKLSKSKRNKGLSNLKFKAGYEKHIIEVENIVRKGNKGVVGGHNFNNFKQAFKDRGWILDECITSIKEHPIVDGIYEVEYRLPALNNRGEIIPGQYKNIPYPKTVYDPNKISDNQLLEWGRKAMEEGKSSGRISADGRSITGFCDNGLKFIGYIDYITREITNFFPTLN
ncbi:hypothetical protein ACOAKC_08320 [Hathewaya histolytica]|uniref:hypothetical protein n=1 Tax=Hathewaya histolytica TaxID=1498 RepID=UPI003B66C418